LQSASDDFVSEVIFLLAEEIKRINVRIGGMSYQLVSSENEAYTVPLPPKPMR
jgi:hypothetical protein